MTEVRANLAAMLMTAAVVTIGAGACGGNEPAKGAWTSAQELQFIAKYREGESRLLQELSPEARASATPTSDRALTCMLKAVEAANPNDAAAVIVTMWDDTVPDDTPLVDDQLSDAIVLAHGVPKCGN